MKPIKTEDMNAVIEYARVHLELKKATDFQMLDKIERHLLSLVEIKRVLKMVRYYGGFEAIQDTLRTAIQAKQPSLFDASKNESLKSETVQS